MDEICVNIRSNRFFESEEIVLIQINGLQEMEQLGMLLGQTAQGGNVLILSGDLGAGKTTLSKSIAKGLGIQQMIKSPTYTLIREYDEGRLPFYHMDVYRIDGDVEGMGLEEYFEGDGLCVVEWGELLTELPEDYLHLTIHKVADEEDKREMSFTAHGKLATDWLAKVKSVGKFHE